MSSIYSIIKRPLVTEKTNGLREDANQYAFEVRIDANKIQIREAIQSFFSVDVASVRTLIVRGKMKRIRRSQGKQPNWKKAIVTLREGQTIELFEGV